MKALLNVTVTNGGYNQLSINSYNASYIIASNAYSDDSKEDVLINDTEWRTNSFSFCHGECSMVTLHTYNKFSVNETNKHTVSPYLAQVNNGSCADIFSVSDNAFRQMISTYPVKFTEDYYECYPHVFDALIDSIGIGAGNAAMYVPLVFSVVLPFLYLWLDYIGIKTPSTEYGNTDKERVWDQLIICLLRAKYKKTKGMEKGNPRSGLIALADDIEDITRRARKKDSKRKRKQKNSEQGNGKSPV